MKGPVEPRAQALPLPVPAHARLREKSRIALSIRQLEEDSLGDIVQSYSFVEARQAREEARQTREQSQQAFAYLSSFMQQLTVSLGPEVNLPQFCPPVFTPQTVQRVSGSHPGNVTPDAKVDPNEYLRHSAGGSRSGHNSNNPQS
ncbi:hypothetical protein U9M48_031282 [Paspalum notatum var. saurae]|uniref:Uncharacterized protein n=1 Tax=Paspalum notatum var. saurae TaxID=547442 RepID=A0AAQ3U6K8_PASNO